MYDLTDPQSRREQYTSTPPGWIIEVDASVSEAGVAIQRLEIKVDPEARPAPQYGLTTTILRSISLPDYRQDFVDHETGYAQFLHDGLLQAAPTHPGYEALAKIYKSADETASKVSGAKPKRAVLRKQREWASQAQSVLLEAREGRGLTRRLQDRWMLGESGTRSRLKRLKKRGWIQGRGTNLMPGPALLSWQATSTTDQGDTDHGPHS